jgi:hypothetical protein
VNHLTTSQNATHTTKKQRGRKVSLDNSPAGGGAGGELSAMIKQNKPIKRSERMEREY